MVTTWLLTLIPITSYRSEQKTTKNQWVKQNVDVVASYFVDNILLMQIVANLSRNIYNSLFPSLYIGNY